MKPLPSDNSRLIRVFVLVTLSVIAVVGVGALSLSVNRALNPFDNEAFVKAAWAVADPPNRAPMAMDAMRHVPVGTSTDQVRELLGDSTPVWRDQRGIDPYGKQLEYPETWSYFLG